MRMGIVTSENRMCPFQIDRIFISSIHVCCSIELTDASCYRNGSYDVRGSDGHRVGHGQNTKSGRMRTNTGSRSIPSLVTEAYWTSHMSLGWTQVDLALSSGFSLTGLMGIVNFLNSSK